MLPAAAVTLAHVAAGTVVLAVGPAAVLVRKGGAWHRRWGAAFVWAMIVVLATATVMWQAFGHEFLLYLDVVCAYLVFQGARVIARRRRRVADPRADRIDLGAAAAVLASVIALLVLAATARTSLVHTLASVLVTIAVTAATFALLDVRALRAGTQTRLGSLLVHIAAMVGAYISAVTAFVVINLHHVPMVARWIVPSVAGSVVIAVYSTAARRRFARGPSTARASSS